ncbi:MAG: prepilin-type N-terminal cleavage/methylation domain-containing protein [Chromatiaceae bacterium]
MNATGLARRAVAPARRRRAGFTLVEVVITLTIMALIMLGLVSALATFGQSRSRVEVQLARIDDVRLVSAFLRVTLSRSSSAYNGRGRSAVAMFQGDARQLRWLGVMPARHGVGGLYQFRLSVVEGPDASEALQLQYLPYTGGGLETIWEAAPTRALVSDISDFGLAYHGGEDDALWQEDWIAQERAPQLVRMLIGAGGRDWPELVIRVRSTDLAGGGVRIVRGAEE